MFFYPSSCLRFAFILIGLPLIFCGCDSDEQKKIAPNVYYDLKEFVTAQITQLDQEKPSVKKAVVSNGKREVRSTKDINWKRELELFLQADLNKSAYRKSYAILSNDSLHYEYALKTGESLPVQSLKIVLDEKGGRPAIVSALIVSKNRLYESKKNIQFTCGSQSGKWMIVSYAIKGYQKLALMDAKVFEVEGQINF